MIIRYCMSPLPLSNISNPFFISVSQKWVLFPEEWKKALQLDHVLSDNESPSLATFDEPTEEEDSHFGTYDHPTRGRLQTYFFENTRNTRLYFDEVAQDWNRMPLFWECNVPEVRDMLTTIDRQIPHWKNLNEQVWT